MSALDVREGDTIRCLSRFGNGATLHTVVGLTATTAKCSDGSVFFLRDGLMKGTRTTGRWSTACYGYLATPEEIAAIKLKSRIRTATNSLERFKVTPENLAAVEALLAPPAKEKA